MKIPRIPHKADLVTIEVVALLFEIPVSMVEDLIQAEIVSPIFQDDIICFRIGDLDARQKEIREKITELILEDGVRRGHFEKDSIGRYRITELGCRFFEGSSK